MIPERCHSIGIRLTFCRSRITLPLCWAFVSRMHERAGCWHSSCVIRPDGTDHGRARARSAREGRAEVTEIDKPTLDEFAARIRALGFDPPQANLEEMYAEIGRASCRARVCQYV